MFNWIISYPCSKLCLEKLYLFDGIIIDFLECSSRNGSYLPQAATKWSGLLSLLLHFPVQRQNNNLNHLPLLFFFSIVVYLYEMESFFLLLFGIFLCIYQALRWYHIYYRNCPKNWYFRLRCDWWLQLNHTPCNVKILKGVLVVIISITMLWQACQRNEGDFSYVYNFILSWIT